MRNNCFEIINLFNRSGIYHNVNTKWPRMRIFICAVTLISVYCCTAHANPVGPYDPLTFPIVILLTILLSFILEYWILLFELEGRITATRPQIRKAFFKANAISFPIAWVILGMLGILGILLAEILAIVIEKFLYNRFLDLRGAGKLGWQAVISANLVSWAAGIVIAMILTVITFPLKPDRNYSKRQIAKIQIAEFEQVIQTFQEDTSRLPKTAEGLDALVRNP
jgi:hypothetical protein